MTGFEFDREPATGSNRHAPDNGCPTCGGDRLIEVYSDGIFEAYARCPDCNPAPNTERKPVDTKAWWKE